MDITLVALIILSLALILFLVLAKLALRDLAQSTSSPGGRASGMTKVVIFSVLALASLVGVIVNALMLMF